MNLDPKHCRAIILAFSINLYSPSATRQGFTQIKLVVFLPEEFRSGKMMSDNVLKYHKTTRTSYHWIKLQQRSEKTTDWPDGGAIEWLLHLFDAPNLPSGWWIWIHLGNVDPYSAGVSCLLSKKIINVREKVFLIVEIEFTAKLKCNFKTGI